MAWFIPAARLLPAQHQRELPGLLMREPQHSHRHTKQSPWHTVQHRTGPAPPQNSCSCNSTRPPRTRTHAGRLRPAVHRPLHRRVMSRRSLLHADRMSHLASPHTRARVTLARQNHWWIASRVHTRKVARGPSRHLVKHYHMHSSQEPYPRRTAVRDEHGRHAGSAGTVQAVLPNHRPTGTTTGP